MVPARHNFNHEIGEPAGDCFLDAPQYSEAVETFEDVWAEYAYSALLRDSGRGADDVRRPAPRKQPTTIVDLERDEHDLPLLPPLEPNMKTDEINTLIRSFLVIHYRSSPIFLLCRMLRDGPIGKVTQIAEGPIHIPWGRILEEQDEFIDAEYLPELFTLNEPTRKRLAEKRGLIEFWLKRQKNPRIKHVFLFKAYPSGDDIIRYDYASEKAVRSGAVKAGTQYKSTGTLNSRTLNRNQPAHGKGKGKARAVDADGGESGWSTDENDGWDSETSAEGESGAETGKDDTGDTESDISLSFVDDEWFGVPQVMSNPMIRNAETPAAFPAAEIRSSVKTSAKYATFDQESNIESDAKNEEASRFQATGMSKSIKDENENHMDSEVEPALARKTNRAAGKMATNVEPAAPISRSSDGRAGPNRTPRRRQMSEIDTVEDLTGVTRSRTPSAKRREMEERNPPLKRARIINSTAKEPKAGQAVSSDFGDLRRPTRTMRGRLAQDAKARDNC